MLLLLQAAAPAAETVVEDGFSKLQVFLQQLIDWGVNAGGHIISAVLIFIVGRFLISFLNKWWPGCWLSGMWMPVSRVL